MSVPPLPPEALDLIRDGAPKPRREPVAESVIAPAPEKHLPVSGRTPLPRAPDERRAKPARNPTPAPQPDADVEVVLVQESYRLPPVLLRGLTRACYERKAKRVRPYRRQDVVAVALERWLRDEGYLEADAKN